MEPEQKKDRPSPFGGNVFNVFTEDNNKAVLAGDPPPYASGFFHPFTSPSGAMSMLDNTSRNHLDDLRNLNDSTLDFTAPRSTPSSPGKSG